MVLLCYCHTPIWIGPKASGSTSIKSGFNICGTSLGCRNLKSDSRSIRVLHLGFIFASPTGEGTPTEGWGAHVEASREVVVFQHSLDLDSMNLTKQGKDSKVRARLEIRSTKQGRLPWR